MRRTGLAGAAALLSASLSAAPVVPTVGPKGALVQCGGGLDLDAQDGMVATLRGLAAATRRGDAPAEAALLLSGSGSLDAARQALVSQPGDKGYLDFFTEVGFAPTFVPLSLESYGPRLFPDTPELGVAESAAWAAKVRKAAFVFLNGGDQIRHTRALMRDDGSDSALLGAIRAVLGNGGIVMGTSAGTHAAGDAMFGGGTSYDAIDTNRVYRMPTDAQFAAVTYDVDKKTGERSPRTPTLDVPGDPEQRLGSYGRGLGLSTGILWDSHSAARGRLGRLLVALAAMRRDGAFPALHVGVGVDENTCVVYDLASQTGWVTGSLGAWILDVGDATMARADAAHFSASGVTLSYLTHGDRFTLSSTGRLAEVVSTKPPVAGASSRARHWRNDPFAPHETRAVVLSLVHDRLATLEATTGLKAPTKAPRYNVTFTASPSTRLYEAGKTGDAVTVDRLNLGINAR